MVYWNDPFYQVNVLYWAYIPFYSTTLLEAKPGDFSLQANHNQPTQALRYLGNTSMSDAYI